MKNKIKILSLILGLSISLVACGKANTNPKDENKKESVNESSKETKSKETKKEKPVKLENLRKKGSPFLSVNDEKVSYEQFYKYYDLYAGVVALQQNLNSNVANLLIRDIIVTKDLEKEKVKITQEEIDAELNKFKASLGGENEFTKYLNMLGTTKETFIENIKNSLKNIKHQQIFAKKEEIKDEEITKHYEDNKNKYDNVNAKHILVKDENLAKDISSKLKKGEDFKALSDKHSIDEAAKKNGGELGVVTANKFDKDFVKAAFELKDGEVSDPVKSQFGYHIIVVNKNNIGKDKNIDKIKQDLSIKKYETSMKEKISKSNIKFFDYDGEEIKK